MEKRSPARQSLDSARGFLRCVLAEQRAAIEELRASNRELESILEEFLAMRVDLRGLTEQLEIPDTVEMPGSNKAVQNLTATQLKREADRVLKLAHDAIRQSLLLRMKSRQLRAALKANPGKRSGEAVGGQSLSRRERQVLGLIVGGKSSKEIAAELGISFKTAVTHRASIMGKLDVHEIASMVREAIRRGLVEP